MKNRSVVIAGCVAWMLMACAEESAEPSIQTENAEGLSELEEEGEESPEEGEESAGEESAGEESPGELDGEEGAEAPDVNPCFELSQEGMGIVLSTATLIEGDSAFCPTEEEFLAGANSAEGQPNCPFEFEADGELCQVTYADCPADSVTASGTFGLDKSGSGVSTFPIELDGEIAGECTYEWTGTFEMVSFEEEGEEGEEGESTGGASCAEVLECLGKCGEDSEPGCEVACIASVEEGEAQDQLESLLGCLEAAGCEEGDDDCFQTNCGDEAFTCYGGGGEPGGLSCSELLGCLEDCPDEGSEEEGSSCEDECFSSASPEAQSLFFAFIECGASSECEDGDEACFNEKCGDLIMECVGGSMDWGDGACPAIMSQEPEVVDEDVQVEASPSNPEECPPAEDLETILDEVNAVGFEQGACKEPTFDGTEDSCAVSFQCAVEGEPTTDSKLTFFEDGTADLSATLGITTDDQTIECNYSGVATWIPAPEEE